MYYRFYSMGLSTGPVARRELLARFEIECGASGSTGIAVSLWISVSLTYVARTAQALCA
jgi:hypothetical protein